VTDTYADTWGFVIDSGLAIFYISGNPYWNSQTNQTTTAPDGYKFDFGLTDKIDFASQMVDANNNPIATLSFTSDQDWSTDQTRFERDVYDKIREVVISSNLPYIHWNHIESYTLDFNNKKITITPYTTSNFYNSTSWTVNYTVLF
jgi:hypothetical protein